MKPDDQDVPAALAGPGTITRRQTTYWELRATVGFLCRVHFRDKVEAELVVAEYPHVAVVSSHPLLVQYDAPLRSLYFAGTPIDPRGLAAMLAERVRALTEGWRSLAGYSARAEATLRAGHGLLMKAPSRSAPPSPRCSRTPASSTSILGAAPARPGQRALVLGRGYVVARAFAFERRAGAGAT